MYLNSSFHHFLAISHVGHAEFPQFFVQKAALTLPEAAVAVDDACTKGGVLQRELAVGGRDSPAPAGGPHRPHDHVDTVCMMPVII